MVFLALVKLPEGVKRKRPVKTRTMAVHRSGEGLNCPAKSKKLIVMIKLATAVVIESASAPKLEMRWMLQS